MGSGQRQQPTIFPVFFAYVLSWMTVILSVLILYWLQKRRYVAVGVLVVVYLFYYSISAQKSVFLFLFLLLFCYLLNRKWMYRWCAGLLSLGVMGCWVLEAGASFSPPCPCLCAGSCTCLSSSARCTPNFSGAPAESVPGRDFGEAVL